MLPKFQKKKHWNCPERSLKKQKLSKTFSSKNLIYVAYIYHSDFKDFLPNVWHLRKTIQMNYMQKLLVNEITNIAMCATVK